MIVLDASTVVAATFRRGSVPHRAVLRALRGGTVAVSDAVLSELLDVLHRPKLARYIHPEVRREVLEVMQIAATRFAPTATVTDCRDPKDNIYLELAVAASAHTIVSSDTDLLVLHPWRGIRILTPAEYLAPRTPAPADSPA